MKFELSLCVPAMEVSPTASKQPHGKRGRAPEKEGSLLERAQPGSGQKRWKKEEKGSFTFLSERGLRAVGGPIRA